MEATDPITESHSFDVVIVGAGIIGLTIARQLLMGSDLSVAIVDAATPCSGATGAGQGYIWMANKTPESATWELAMRSKKQWEMLAESIQHQGMNPQEVLGWKKTGSLLIGRTPDELAMLERRMQQLSGAGLKTEFLSRDALLSMEPALEVGKELGAIFLPDDCQLDAWRTVEFLEKVNRQFTLSGRYAEFYHEPAISLLRSDSDGEVEAVKTSKNLLHSKKAIIIAAGCWSGCLMYDLVKELNILLDVPVKPRKGHLLVIENFSSFQLNHGLMEVGYVDHQFSSSHPTSSGVFESEQNLSISMTATMDTMGNLVLGSSRQFVGFSTDVEESIVDRIWQRAGEFFPALRNLSLTDLVNNKRVRVGLRPYMPDGKPMIGPVPGLPKVFLATGHGGEGLCTETTTGPFIKLNADLQGTENVPGLCWSTASAVEITAMGTAEMVADMVLGNPGRVDFVPFAVEGR